MKAKVVWVAALGLLGVCGCVDTSGTRVVVDTSSGEARVLENSQAVANRVKVRSVTYGEVNSDGFRRATIVLESLTKKRLNLQVRVVWTDEEGTELESASAPYRTVILDGLDTCTVTGVAPNAKGVAAKLNVKLED